MPIQGLVIPKEDSSPYSEGFRHVKTSRQDLVSVEVRKLVDGGHFKALLSREFPFDDGIDLSEVTRVLRLLFGNEKNVSVVINIGISDYDWKK